MSTYVINWNNLTSGATADDVALDGTTAISNGTGHAVNVTVSTPPAIPNPATPGNATTATPGEEWTLANSSTGGNANTLVAYSVNDPTQATIQFDTAMTGITFEIYDIDADINNLNPARRWDDLVKVYALDINGNPMPTAINITNLNAGTHTVNSDGTTTTIGATGNADPAVQQSGAADTVTVSIPGPVYGFVVVYDNGPSVAISGVVGIGPITFFDPTVWCFARGTMIETKFGDVAIEDLLAGDMVRTADNGFQPLRWIGSTTVKATGSKAPILFRKGAIGNTKDLLVSPAHRVMLQDWQSELLFGGSELLASAQSLVNDNTIIRQETDEVEYFHILFDSHEIVFSNGAPSESFHPGDADVGTMAQEARDEIYSLFPELQDNPRSYGPSARTTLMPHEASLLSL